MNIILIKALQLILSLSILVVVHEFGHFLFARLFKIRVEKFYLFFDPWFSLFKFKPKNSDTEYGVGWLPLGGYVKISGMIDESMDKEQMKQPAQPWEFRAKPAWQRLLVMIGGVLFNILLAIFIYSMVIFTWGDRYLPLKNVKHGMEYSSIAKEVGFVNGDILLKADGKELKGLDMNTRVDLLTAKSVTIMRQGNEMEIKLPDDFMTKHLERKESFAEYFGPLVIAEVVEDSPAAFAGIQPKDSIVSVNDIPVSSFHELSEQLSQNRGSVVALELYRDNVASIVSVEMPTGDVMLGVRGMNPLRDCVIVHDEFSFFSSFPAGYNLAIATLKGYVAQFKYVFTKAGASSIGGFGTLGNLFPAQWNWYAFWMMTAFLSVVLAFMNILPIPALDGGHVVFLFYEIIARKKPNEKFMEYAQVVGMLLLFSLLIFANGNDLFRAIFK